MNDEQARQLARERRFTGDLAAAIDAPLATVARDLEPPTRRKARWFFAAACVLGAGVATGVGWLQATAVQHAQDRRFDPVRPWFENAWPFRTPADVVQSAQEAADLPSDQVRVTVSARAGDLGMHAVLRRKRIEELFAMSGASGDRAMPWNELTAHDELHTLLLSGSAWGLTPTDLRELRRLPNLHTLSLAYGAIRIDEPTASALVELPKLRHLAIAASDMTPAGIAALSGLPHLDTLFVQSESALEADALVLAIARIRTLRALFIEIDGEVQPSSLEALHELDHLTALSLTHVDLDDRLLAALPSGLEYLRLPSLSDVTATAVARLHNLKKLKSLHLSGLPTRLEAAACSLVRELPLEALALSTQCGEQLWRSLQQQRGLRRLELRCNARTRATILRRAAEIEDLEMLVLHVEDLPTAQELQPLHSHENLRHIRLVRHSPATHRPSSEQIAKLRSGLRAELEVR